MIKKLKPLTEVDENNNPIASHMPDGATLMGKINELVDAVNEIMTWRFETDDEPAETPIISKKEKADPYAEQRRWIGKLCKFWDDDEDEGYIYEILIDIIDDGSDYPYKIMETDCRNWTLSYKHCEPVLEDLIYKGGDNE